MNRILFISAYFLILLLLCGCGATQVVRVQTEAREELVNRRSKYLKLYMNDGSLYILNSWQIDDFQKKVSGTGMHYDIKRNLTGVRFTTLDTALRPFEINKKDIVLAETKPVKEQHRQFG